MTVRSRIIGTGSYAPKRVVTNKDLEALVKTSDAWIVERTGIRERRMAEPGENTSDLAYNAGTRALQAAGVKPGEIDMIIVATVTPDMLFPSTACLVQERLGAWRASAFDLSAGCAGFVYALSVVDFMIRGGGARTVLLVGAEVLSRLLNWRDRSTCVLFCDGAGAAVVRAESGDRGILSTHIRADGGHGMLIHIPGGGTAHPATHETIDQGLHYVKMQGNDVFKLAVRSLEEVSREALTANNVRVEDVGLLVPHQANLRIIQAVAKRLDLPWERVYVNVDRYGNTSSASIPLALDEALGEGRIRAGDLVLMSSFGAGLTWGSALVRW